MGRLNIKMYRVFSKMGNTQKQLSAVENGNRTIPLDPMVTKILLAQFRLNEQAEGLESNLSEILKMGSIISLVDEQLDLR